MTGWKVAFSALCATATFAWSAAPASADFSYAGPIGGNGTGDGQFDRPYGVAVSPVSGNIYVADLGNNRVQEFSPAGAFILKFGTAGSGDGQFSSPEALAFSPSGNLYVIDLNNHRVEEFTSSGVFITQFGSLGSGPGQFDNPEGIAVSPVSGDVYVTDSNSQRVQEFTSDGTYVNQFGSSGSGDGQFSSPSGVVVTPSGNLYVADNGNNRVQLFTSGGAYLAQFDGTASGGGQLNGPFGIALSPDSGNVYVTESGTARVQQFSPAGAFIARVGAGYLSSPTYLAVATGECVYVTVFPSYSIKRFGSACPPPPSPPPALARIRGLSISPTSFRAASSGASISAQKSATGATVRYTDSQAAQTSLRVFRRVNGYRKTGACVVVRPAGKQKLRRCTLYRLVGSFSHNDKLGSNRFHFSGRVGGHKLSPGAYRLQAVPTSVGGSGAARTADFKVKR